VLPSTVLTDTGYEPYGRYLASIQA